MDMIHDIEAQLARIPEQDWTPAVRGYITRELHSLIQALQPYVDGTMGPVSSKHVSNQLAALNLLGRLHRCFDQTQVEVQDPDAVAAQKRAALRDQVRGQILSLEQRAS